MRTALTPEGKTMADYPGSLPVEQCRRMLLMLRHELVTLNGLHATDRPSAWSEETSWVLDETPLLVEIDQILGFR